MHLLDTPHDTLVISFEENGDDGKGLNPEVQGARGQSPPVCMITHDEPRLRKFLNERSYSPTRNTILYSKSVGKGDQATVGHSHRFVRVSASALRCPQAVRGTLGSIQPFIRIAIQPFSYSSE